MHGWDEAGYRLGDGGGFSDRTLASLTGRAIVIGVMKTIHPHSEDIPMDWVVSERGVYRRDPEGLAFLGETAAGRPSALASPVCYAEEIAPECFDEQRG